MRWLVSKTVWGAVGLVALGVVDALNGDYSAAAQRALEALALIGIRHGVWKMGPARGPE